MKIKNIRTKKFCNKGLSFITIFSVLFLMSGWVNVQLATAATVSSLKDTMSTQATSTTATHVITWTLVGGDTVAAADTYTIDFVDADFTLNAIANWQTTDFAFNDGTSRTITAVSSTSGVAPTCTSGSNNVAVTINTTTNNFVVTACTSYSASSANAAITFTINGTTASGTGTMTNKSSDVDSSLVALSQSNGDSSNAAVVVETNDIVTITATVNPTLTFAISSASVALGTLSTGSATTGSHTISVSSNATAGFAVTYNGPTLTSGSNTIAAYSALSSSSAGTEGFGINLKSNSSPSVGSNPTTNAGTCGIATNYNTANSFTWIASTATPVTSVSAPADCVYTVSYVANISTITPAGSYSSATTYVAAGTF